MRPRRICEAATGAYSEQSRDYISICLLLIPVVFSPSKSVLTQVSPGRDDTRFASKAAGRGYRDSEVPVGRFRRGDGSAEGGKEVTGRR